MSVAANPVAARTPRSPQQRLAVESLLGAVYVLAALWVVFAGLPALWTDVLQLSSHLNEFLSDALLLVSDLVLAVALWWVGYRILRTQTQPGLRAGIFLAAIEIFFILWIGVALGRLLQTQDFGAGLGAAVTVVVMLVLAAGVAYLFLTPGWFGLLRSFEEQGWFTQTPYKGNQGVRIRRATVLGALILGFSGIITMVSHRSFGSDRLGPNDWYWTIPFTSRTIDMDRVVTRLHNGDALNENESQLVAELVGNARPDANQIEQLANESGGRTFTRSFFVPLMFKVHVVVPVVLALLLLWFSYRLVNVPTFADFLVATEAEMNKVSWTTRRRLFQDTIVVLVTVFLMTLFLFLIDLLWIKVLTAVNVLQVDVKAQLQKQQEKSQW